MHFKTKLLTGVFAIIFATLVHAQVVLQELNGNKIPFSSLKGKWVFINYWASWCEPCLAEIEEFNRFYAKNKHQNVALFAVNYDMVSASEQKHLAKRYNIQYPILKQDPGKMLNLGQIRGVPATFVFNPQGKLVKTLYGEQSMSNLCAINSSLNC